MEACRKVTSGISVIVPTVAPRRAMLREALRSVADQAMPPAAIIIQDDVNREGAAATRQKAQDRVDTEWTCPLDDDDILYPQHCEVLLAEAERTNADLVYGWFDCTGSDPFPQFEGIPWDDTSPHLFPVTWLARTEVIRAAGGWRNESQELYGHSLVSGEDWNLVLSLVRIGAKIVHLPERTWRWVHHGGNSSGLPANIWWNG